ncbi:MAG: hypothetical protein U9R15_07020 [Chloroflexota bacterium]|nr:hypothetical protein [Chloroflexota bacterium]
MSNSSATIHGQDRTPDQDEREKLAIFESFLATVHHFFGSFNEIFRPVDDPRHPAFITYPLEALFFACTLMFLCRLKARRQIALMFRNNNSSAAKFQDLFGTNTCAHGDTVDEGFSRLNPNQVQEVVTGMVKTLIRKKVLYRYRLLGMYFVIAIDGTGRLTFPKRHCPHCMTVTHNGKTTYYHPVLEAKLVLPNGFTFSIMTEFIENSDENTTKQDCELKAFYRLAKRLKEAFPRLRICLSLDSLFDGGPTMTICEDYGWKFMIVNKKDDIPYITDEFEALLPLAPENHLRFHTGVQNEILQEYRWVNDISYVDSKGDEHTVGVLECLETKPNSDGELETTRFKWVTNFKIKRNKVIALANEGGRIRWKIENEGFNVQKNEGFDLEHAYTTNFVASKIFYLLLQIAHMIAQLIEKGSLFRKAFPAGVGSAKNIAFRLLEAWRNLRLSADQIQKILDARRQIRFAPP